MSNDECKEDKVKALAARNKQSEEKGIRKRPGRVCVLLLVVLRLLAHLVSYTS